MTEPMWDAEFHHPQHPWRDDRRQYPVTTEVPPAAIRRPSMLAGMPAYDIFLLSDSEPWPARSTYTYSQSVLGNMADDEPPPYCFDDDR